MSLSAVLFLFVSAPASAAGPAPSERSFADPAMLLARAQALRAFVADPSASDIAVKERAGGDFDQIPGETFVIPAFYRPLDRETVTGKLGTVDGMQQEAEKRLELWRRTHKEPPPPNLEAAMSEGRAMNASGRMAYDDQGLLSSSQMGVFRYTRDRLTGGLIQLNARLRLLATLVGEAFAYATVAHESQHSRDHAAGLLAPETETNNELSAFRTQYDWLKLMDPSGDRMAILHSTLKIKLKSATGSARAALRSAIEYLEHLSDVVSTNGTEKELRKLVERLYKGGRRHHDHDDGHSA